MRRLSALLLCACSAPTITVAERPAGALRVESFDPFFRFFQDATRAERRKNVVESLLATRDEIDVVCVSGLGISEDREPVLAGVRARFPYVGYVATNRSTPIEDPRDDRGAVQSVEMTVPCSDPEQIARMDAEIACAQKGCVGADGFFNFVCFQDTCKSLTAPSGRCGVCWSNAMAMGPVERVHRTCAETPRGELGDDGAFPAAILSRYPLSEVEAHVFPSTLKVRGAITARVNAARPIYVVCNELQAWTGAPLPYTGVFAPRDATGWDGENLVMRARAVDLAAKFVKKGPTLLLGGPLIQWSSNARGEFQVTSDFHWLGVNAAPLFPPSAVCTLCDDNPVADHWYRGRFRDFDQLVFGGGAYFTVTDTALERTEARFLLGGVAGTVGPKFGASARVSW